jgi:hypothetical protein
MSRSDDRPPVHRPRVRRRLGRALTAVVATAALVAMSFLAMRSEPVTRVFTASGRAAIESAAPGWRWEMWANVQLQVPDTWDRAQDLRRACFIEDQLDGFVSRPSDGGIMEDCPDWAQAPTTMPNLAFLDEFAFPGTPGPGTRSYPHAKVTVAKVGSVSVMITAPGDALTRRILDSAQMVVGADAAGCPVGAQAPILGHAVPTGPSIAHLTDVDLVSVCRYYRGGLSYAFTQSGVKATALVTALRAAPTGAGPDNPKDCELDATEEQAGLYRLWSADSATDVWVHWDPCRGHGIDDGTSTRRLTADTLVPFVGVAFSGGVSKSVPLSTASTRPGRWPVFVP